MKSPLAWACPGEFVKTPLAGDVGPIPPRLRHEDAQPARSLVMQPARANDSAIGPPIEAAARNCKRGTTVRPGGLTHPVVRSMHPGVRRPALEFVTIIV